MAEKATSSEAEQCPDSLQDKLLGVLILRLPNAGDTPLYHVHQRAGVLICDDFLLGLCSLQEKCPNHHTPFPYHWQWRRKKDHVWLSFSFSAQHHLERLYCNKECSSVPLQNRSVFLDLRTLQLSGITPQLYDKIRRLSNSSNPECNPYFPVEWKVYWMSSGAWKEYTEPVSRELVDAFEWGMWNHAFYLHDRLYHVNIKQLTQCNVKTGFTRHITYRPVLRSCVTLAPYLRTLAPSLHSAAVPGDDPEDFYYGSYPATWVPAPQEGSSFTMTEMTLSEVAYQKVWKHFHASLPEDKALVLAIYRIRNDKLWNAFIRQKKRMSRARSVEDQFILERHLFHGTGAQQIKPICTRNFDPCLAGLRHGAVFGRGSYFARDSERSHKYAKATNNIYHMFLAKVLTGNWIEGNPALKRPSVSYDSCVNSPFDPNIFVVFRSSQCYPYFLIRYKKVNTQVNVDN